MTKSRLLLALVHCTQTYLLKKKWMTVLSYYTQVDTNSNLLLLTHDGYYLLKDGLLMRNPPATNLANCWLSNIGNNNKGEDKIF